MFKCCLSRSKHLAPWTMVLSSTITLHSNSQGAPDLTFAESLTATTSFTSTDAWQFAISFFVAFLESAATFSTSSFTFCASGSTFNASCSRHETSDRGIPKVPQHAPVPLPNSAACLRPDTFCPTSCTCSMDKHLSKFGPLRPQSPRHARPWTVLSSTPRDNPKIPQID